MSNVEKIKSELRALSVQELEEIRDWLEGFLEDQLQVTDEFKASVERGRNDLITLGRRREVYRRGRP